MSDARLLETGTPALLLESGNFRALESYVAAVTGVPAIVGTPTANAGGASNTCTVAKPSGTTVGETLVVVGWGFTDGFTNSAFTWTPPSGFTETTHWNPSGDAKYARLAVFTRTVDGTEGSSFTVTHSYTTPGPFIEAMCFRVSGVVTTTVGSGDSGTSATGNFQDIAVPANTLVLGVVGGWSSSMVPSVPSGWVDVGSTGDASQRVRSLAQATAATVPDTTFTYSSSEFWSTVTVGLTAKPYLKYRTFDGVDDEIDMALGTLASTVLRPCTWAMYLRPLALPSTTAGDASVLLASPGYDPVDWFTNYRGLGLDEVWWYDGASNYQPTGTIHHVADNEWSCVVFRISATGVAQGSGWAASTGWRHSAATSAGTYGSRSFSASGVLGFNFSPHLNADYVCAAHWNSVLTDVQVETLINSFTAWQALSPTHLWRFADTTPDDLIGNCDVVTITGTTLPGLDSPLAT